MKTILILEDNDERIAGFKKAVLQMGERFELKIWHDAPTMMTECVPYFAEAALICLDHDLNPQPGITTNPGTGLDAAKFLAAFLPACPVLIHSTNVDRVCSMYNEFRFADWVVDRVGPLGPDWIETTWMRRACEMIAQYPNTWKANLPPDHAARVERMQLSLDGLGLGDALGEMLNYQAANAIQKLADDLLPAGPWFHTDDTEMAISVVTVLKSQGELNQDALARHFAHRFARDPERGYGKMTRIQLREINTGAKWREMAANAFNGQGSMGNGGAMRAAPLGAYFADDLIQCAEAARASALVTHTHPEGVAGTIAVALAAALAWQLRDISPVDFASQFFNQILQFTPDGQVRRGILIASQTSGDIPFAAVAQSLGNGSLVTAPDTVPFCLWMAAHHPKNFVEAIGRTISVGGDCDTNAAIVGGIVALSAGRANIPTGWLATREKIQI